MTALIVLEQCLASIDGARVAVDHAPPQSRHRLKVPFLARMTVCGSQAAAAFFDVVVTV